MRHTIYIVMGSTGEYSDRTEWPVIAYSNKADAERHIELASEEYRRIVAEFGDYFHWPWKDDAGKKLNRYDPNMKGDYTGTMYYYWEVELSNALVDFGGDQ